MSRLAALYALGLDLSDIPRMKRDLLDAIKRSNAELVESFR